MHHDCFSWLQTKYDFQSVFSSMKVSISERVLLREKREFEREKVKFTKIIFIFQ
jgi:hypothetical protein